MRSIAQFILLYAPVFSFVAITSEYRETHDIALAQLATLNLWVMLACWASVILFTKAEDIVIKSLAAALVIYLILGNIADEYSWYMHLKYNAPTLFIPERKSLANIGIFILTHIGAVVYAIVEYRKRNKTWRR